MALEGLSRGIFRSLGFLKSKRRLDEDELKEMTKSLRRALQEADFNVRQTKEIVDRLEERQITYSGPKDRGFMDSIYFRDPLGLLIEIASYRFMPPIGSTHSDVLREAHLIRLELGEYNINQKHLALAIEKLSKSMRPSLSK